MADPDQIRIVADSPVAAIRLLTDENEVSTIQVFGMPVISSSGGGGGNGSVSSVAMTVPTGLSVSGSPITSSGAFDVTYSSGYSIPTTTKQGQWDAAYSWGDHSERGYALSSSLGNSSALNTGTTAGTVALGNDPRFTDTRNPTAHGFSHTNGNDDIQLASSTQKGLMSADYASKLDGIEAGATADQSAAEILAALLTVDGAGSGLDADLLEGYHASDFSLLGHNHNSDYAPLAHVGDAGNPHNVTPTQIGLGNVENTALSTWAGSTNITTLGNVTTGTWSGTAIEATSLASTGETGGTKFLREDGDGTCSFVAIPGGGDALTSATLDQFANVTQAGGTTLSITANTTLAGGTYSGNVTGNNTGDQDLTPYATKAADLDQFANVTQTTGKTLAITGNTTLAGGNHSGNNTGDQDLSGYSLTSHNHDGTYQPLDSDLTAIAALSNADNNFIVGNGTAWVVESGAAARTSLGLGTAATAATGDFEAAGAVSTHAAITSGVHGISAFGATLVDDTSASAARTTLGVDAAGTDNSTPVTLAGHNYLTLSGQQITAGNVSLTGNVTGILPLANGGTGAALSDPGADRIAFWDDSASSVAWLTVGANLTITGTTLDASGGGGSGGGNVSDGDTLAIGLTFPDDGLKIDSANGTYDLTLGVSGNLTANRTVDFVDPDGNVTIDLGNFANGTFLPTETLGNATTGNVSTANTTLNPLTDGSGNTVYFYAQANRRYSFAAYIPWKGPATTDGFKISVSGPASPNTVWYAFLTPTTTGTINASSAATAFGTTLTQAGGVNMGGAWPIMTLNGYLDNGSTAGNVTVEIASEVGSNTTFYTGAHIVAHQLP